MTHEYCMRSDGSVVDLRNASVDKVMAHQQSHNAVFISEWTATLSTM